MPWPARTACVCPDPVSDGGSHLHVDLPCERRAAPPIELPSVEIGPSAQRHRKVSLKLSTAMSESGPSCRSSKELGSCSFRAVRGFCRIEPMTPLSRRIWPGATHCSKPSLAVRSPAVSVSASRCQRGPSAASPRTHRSPSTRLRKRCCSARACSDSADWRSGSADVGALPVAQQRPHIPDDAARRPHGASSSPTS